MSHSPSSQNGYPDDRTPEERYRDYAKAIEYLDPDYTSEEKEEEGEQ